MISSPRDLQVFTREDFARLPDEGRWEVVDGRAVLMPPPEIPHQRVVGELAFSLQLGVRSAGRGFVILGPNIFIPSAGSRGRGAVQTRVPDLTLSLQCPERNFEDGDPPQLAIEVLSTPRGNVERTEKLDDYARAGILEYWIVDRFRRCVEVYLLEGGTYVLQPLSQPQVLRPVALPQIVIEMEQVWRAVS